MSLWKKWFCKHEWDIQISTIVKPTHPNKLKDWNYSGKEFAELTQGVTRALMTCSECGMIEERRILGVPEDKIDAGG